MLCNGYWPPIAPVAVVMLCLGGCVALSACSASAAPADPHSNPKRLAITVRGQRVRAELGSYCLPERPGVMGCSDDAFDASPRGHLDVRPRDRVILHTGASAKSVGLRLVRAGRHRQAVNLGGLLHAGAAGQTHRRWTVRLPRSLHRARILETFVRYSSGDASFEADIRPVHRGQRHHTALKPRFSKTESMHPSHLVIAGLRFVAAGAHVHHECQRTANAVGYPVPCPTMLPKGLVGTPPAGGCPGFHIVGWDRTRGCGAMKWRSWMVGSSQLSGPNAGPAGFQHLALQGAPHVVRNPARAIDGPGMFPGSRVQPHGSIKISGYRMRWYFVPPGTNGGSAFMHHLVLVWTTRGHTYAYGFHVVTTVAAARKLDLELVRHLVTVHPS